MNSVAMIAAVAASLGQLRDRFVFVGGATLELLITDPAVLDFRPTTDVDLVVEVATYGSYASVEQTLSDRGFTHVVDPAVPICRWLIGGINADVMPTDESILGFSSRWYTDVVRSSIAYNLPSGITIRVIAPQFFMATKFEAFRTRGNGDARTSYDMEDIIAVLDGRPGIEQEIASTSSAVRNFVATEFRQLEGDTDFQDAIQGYLAFSPNSATRRERVLSRIATIVQNSAS
ncbi:MAG: nucleotidyl transferase AbiEii/AbiGii toxin family protein [Spirochaeta sp.]|nr:nucleotidyl transferase AbiEii/AbiGii toxin family protein [Spirochaeta sp.]